jgi:SH3 domain-containing YSC84-like protein 1
MTVIFQDFSSDFGEKIQGETSIKPVDVIDPMSCNMAAWNFLPSRAFIGRVFSGSPIMKTRFAALTGLSVLLLVAASSAQAAPADEKAELLRDANTTVDNLKHDPAFATAARMMRDARAVYIVPKLIKGGFMFGAEGGDGVLLHRTGSGWSTPRFYGMGSASFGLQIGLQQAELVFIINSQRALDGIEHGNFKLGAGAGVTVVTLSSGAEAATTAHGGDVVVWTSGSGAYAGISFNGTVISPDKSLNATPATGPEAEALRANLAGVR